MEKLLRRSYELENELRKFFELGLFDDTMDVFASRAMCSLAFEHAEAVKYLIAAEKHNTAISLVRLQFEVLVKGMWLLFAAPDDAIEKLFTDVTLENFNQLNQAPGLSQMLEELKGKAPEGATTMLSGFKECHWKSLCSFVHGGVLAFQTHALLMPSKMLKNILKTSNAISTMIAMLLILLSGVPEHHDRLTALQKKYADCFPTLLPA
ncbi:DUF6988 family protein [Microbulbifer agarilyticus]|uniref:DUF6988 family protein n=1 Tax=Microbulbifer agarilyticus TaxID=260552 RepID=UPI001CD277C8|nr:hypothetical protein [Microbulbifer agarilyticus]MCA0899301.1 hypothetical protein [Microbulbifer agarilyticus]